MTYVYLDDPKGQNTTASEANTLVKSIITPWRQIEKMMGLNTTASEVTSIIT